MAGEEQQRRRVLGRLRQFLLRKRSPRAILSGILLVTALAGFLASVGMLKLGLAQMWLRYPLAVLGAWGVFLALVRVWAESEREAVRLDEEMAALGPKDDVLDGEPGRSVLGESGRRSRAWDWLDWLNPFEALADDAAGCLVGLLVLVALVALGGVVVMLAGLIVQAEVLLAEVLLDVLLVSALNKHLHRLEPQWWLASTVRQTVWPVLATMAFLTASGYLLQMYAPEARSIGGVWKHYRAQSVERDTSKVEVEAR